MFFLGLYLHFIKQQLIVEEGRKQIYSSICQEMVQIINQESQNPKKKKRQLKIEQMGGSQTIIWSIWSTTYAFLDITCNYSLLQKNNQLCKTDVPSPSNIMIDNKPDSIVCSFPQYLENQDLLSVRFGKIKEKMSNKMQIT